MKQATFASLAFEHKKKLNRREQLLKEMDETVPWERHCKAPHSTALSCHSQLPERS
jgi:hypothetical protein